MKTRMFVCRTPGCKNQNSPGAINISDYYDAETWPPVKCVCGVECDFLEIETSDGD